MTKGLHKFKKKRFIIPAALVVFVIIVMLLPKKPSALGMVKTEELMRRTLKNTISTTGVIESTDAVSVYSHSANAVKTVNFLVGDKVEAGDILCELDTESLLLDIAQQKASMNNSAKTAQHSINTAENNYDYTKEVQDKDLNMSIVNARSAVTDARKAFEDADDALDDADDDHDAESAAISSARNILNTCKTKLAAAQKTYNTEKNNLTIGASQLENYANAVKDAEDALKTAQGNYDKAIEAYNLVDKTYDELEEARAKASRAYNNAQKNYDSVVLAAQNGLETAKDSVTGSKISASGDVNQIMLDKYELQLEECTVKAPISGTITEVYAKEGASGSGLLFIIEDINSLKVTTSIKEYDIGSAKTGLPAIIKADATGNKEFSGAVSKIAPAASKGADGKTQTGANVQFDTEIAVDSAHEGLLIGMNTRVNIILKELENVYGVPYDAVVTDESGKKVIYYAVADEKGMYTAKAVPVTTGLETDFYIEISGEGLTDGALIITNPENITDGAKVQVRK